MFSKRFRWVFCQLEVLRHSFPANLRHVLMELPQSLDETYVRILKEIKNANRKHAYRLLQCLVATFRPLRVEELAQVLAVDFNAEGIPKFNPILRWEDQEMAVLSTCSSLVAVVIENGFQVVQFSHFSVKEFLTSDRLASSKEEVAQFHISVEPSHATLARACLSVLLCLDDRSDEDSIKEIPLLRYASEYWYRHAAVGNVESQIKDAMDRFFDTDKPHFSAWIRIRHQFDLLTVSESKPPKAVPLPAAPLYFAAKMGFRGQVERLLLKYPQQVNCLGSLYGTPLHASVLGGHIEVARLLFAHGADVNFQRDDGQTPLHFATSHGHLEVARLLLERNAEVNARDSFGSTPLLNASMNGNADVVRLLLDNNADVRAHYDNGDTSLHLAAVYGHLKVARLLLERNADVDSRNDLGSTPLFNASVNGNLDFVRLLLDHNADPYARDNNGDTSVHFATSHGHLEVALLLLERNAEVNACDNVGSTPLLNASVTVNGNPVRLLLEHNADAHAHDNIQPDTLTNYLQKSQPELEIEVTSGG